MRGFCRITGFIVAMLLSGASVGAITFDQIFFAGDGRDGQLGAARSQFTPDESRIYLRFIYREGRPGEELIAHWQIVEDIQGRSGEFASSRMTLEKSADRGQFSYTAEEPWPIGRYRVTITDSANIIVEELDYQVVAKNQAPKPAPVRKTSAANIKEEQDELPPPFTDIFAPAPSRLAISRTLTVGRSEAQQFKADEPVIYVRYEYVDAAPAQAIDAVWEHLGHAGHPGIGIFARDRVTLEKSSGRAQFSFRPKPAGSWLPGDYKVTLLEGSQILANANFSIIPKSGEITSYSDIVVAVSNRTGLPQEAVNRLFLSQPALFGNFRATLEDLKTLDRMLSRTPETLSSEIHWQERIAADGPLQAFRMALRGDTVSKGLLPEGVSPPGLDGRLLRTYSAVRPNRSVIQAYTETLAQAGDFTARRTLYAQLIKAKGQSPDSAPPELLSYLQGKADLYWRNRLEVAYQHARLKERKAEVVDTLWAQNAGDLQRIRDAAR